MSTANIVFKVDEVAKEFKEKQKELISAFVSGNDFFGEYSLVAFLISHC